MSQPPGERKEENQRNAIKIKQFSKALNLSVSSREKVQLAKSYHCPLADGTELSFFININVMDLCTALRKQRLC